MPGRSYTRPRRCKACVWRCPSCGNWNGWRSRDPMGKKKVDTICSICTDRVRFTPVPATWNSGSRGRPPKVKQIRVFSVWLPWDAVKGMATQWNRLERERMLERAIHYPDDHSSIDLEDEYPEYPGFMSGSEHWRNRIRRK